MGDSDISLGNDDPSSLFILKTKVLVDALKCKKVLPCENARGILPVPYPVHGISWAGQGVLLSWSWLRGWQWGSRVPCPGPGWGGGGRDRAVGYPVLLLARGRADRVGVPCPGPGFSPGK